MSILVEGQKAAYAIGENGGTFVNRAADALGDFVCGLYRDYPGAVVDQSVPVIRDFGTGIMDGLCGKRRIGTPPSLPIPPGGQCVCQTYTLTFVRTDTDPVSPGAPSNSTGSYPGPIGGIFKRPTAGRLGFFDWFVVAGAPACSSAGGVALAVAERFVYTLTSIVPNAGQQNNCGNAPDRHPIVPIPPERSNTTINLPLSGGGRLTIPVAYVPIKPTLSIPVQPKFGFDLGGIPVTLDAGGFTFNLPDSPENRLPGGSDTGTNSPGRTNDKVDEVGRKVDDLRRNPVPCIEQPPKPTPGEPELPPTETQPSKGSDEDVPGLKYLEVVLTKLPDKEHFGNGGQNVFFAGWIAFRAKSGGYYPREQINFRQSVFPAPEGSDGYTVTFTNGAEGRVREYTEPVSKE